MPILLGPSEPPVTRPGFRLGRTGINERSSDAARLEDFLALVDLGHFSRAAEQRCITQPTFSRRVRALEEWVGTPLFNRDVLPVTLTAASERFRPVADETLRRLYLGREDAREAGRLAASTVRIASTQTLSVSFFPNWVRTIDGFERTQATMNLTAAHMAACEQMMLRGEAQFLMCHDHPATTHIPASAGRHHHEQSACQAVAFFTFLTSPARYIALQHAESLVVRAGVVMAIVLDTAKNLRSRHLKIMQERQAFLKVWLAAAIRRGADRRFVEQLDQIERTGRAGAF